MLKLHRNINQVSNGLLKTANGRVVFKKQSFLKAPEGICKRAIDKDLYSETEFYYQLKGTNNEGHIKKYLWNRIKNITIILTQLYIERLIKL